jgi:hypothetical protein
MTVTSAKVIQDDEEPEVVGEFRTKVTIGKAHQRMDQFPCMAAMDEAVPPGEQRIEAIGIAGADGALDRGEGGGKLRKQQDARKSDDPPLDDLQVL